jgi:hypothetical protein
MRYVLSFISIFIFFNLSAQKKDLIVSTDFENCGVGLKDSAGNWVLTPSYDRITSVYNSFAFYVVIGKKEGVVDSRTGRVIIPAIYNHISNRACPENGHIFYVSNGGSDGVIDMNGRIIVPVEYSWIIPGPDTTFAAKDFSGGWTIFRYDGSKTILPFKSKNPIIPLGEHIYLFSKKYYGKKTDMPYARSPRALIGVINDSGRVIVPAAYDRITFSPDKKHVITVYKNDKLGFFNVNGKLILPAIFTDPFTSYFDYSYQECNGANFPSFINENGFVTLTYGNKWGMVSASGDTLLPFTYDQISGTFPASYYLNTDHTKDNYITTKDSLCGVFSPAKGWILKPEFQVIHDLIRYLKPDSNCVDVFIAKKNGYWGAITSTNQIILPFEYDKIYSEYTDEVIFRKGDNLFCMTFPIIYGFAGTNIGFITGSDKNFAVKTIPSSGLFSQRIFPDNITIFYNPEIHDNSKHADYLNANDGKFHHTPFLFDNLFDEAAIVIQPVKISRQCENGNWIMKYKDVSILHDSANGDERFMLETNEVNGNYHIYKMMESCFDSSYHYYLIANDYSSTGIVRSDGKIIIQPLFGSGIIQPFTDDEGIIYFRVIAYNKKKKDYYEHIGMGLFDTDGKLVVDTAWQMIGPVHKQYVWVQISGKQLSRKARKGFYMWNILNTQTGTLLLPEGKETSLPGEFGNGVTIINRLDGNRLYNLDKKSFITTSAYSDYIKLDPEGNWFAAKTCYGHIGILDVSGNWFTDTSWTSLMDATYDSTFKPAFTKLNSYDLHTTYNSRHYFVLSNADSRIIIDLKNKKIVTDSALKNSLLTQAMQNYTTAVCQTCPKLVNDSSIAALNDLAPWQKEILFDSIFSPVGTYKYESEYNFCYSSACRYCAHQGVHTFNQNWNKGGGNYSPVFINDSVISTERFSTFYGWDYQYNKADHFFTVMLFKDGPHPIFLDSLFIGTEWKNLIIDSVVTYLNTHLYIKGDCHNNASFPILLNENFLLSQNGLLLFPPGYMQGPKQLMITIPWQYLKPYMRKDILQKLNLK